jgi:hypothetical protein
MTSADQTDGVGYVICGYLDSEGPEAVTVEGDYLSGGRPYATIEEAVAEIDSNGGPRADANIFVGAVVPVALIVQPDQDSATNLARGEEIIYAFGSFYSNDEAELIQTAGKGANSANEELNFNNEGELD